jgi:hypothetical protein
LDALLRLDNQEISFFATSGWIEALQPALTGRSARAPCSWRYWWWVYSLPAGRRLADRVSSWSREARDIRVPWPCSVARARVGGTGSCDGEGRRPAAAANNQLDQEALDAGLVLYIS